MSRNSIGVLTLDLVVKAGSFTQGMNAAERQANKSLTAIEKRAFKFGQSLGMGLKTAGTAAFGAMAVGLGIYVKNTIEAEKVQAQLASRIKDTGSAAGRTLAQLNAQADKLQGMTIFDDEAIGGVQAMLLTFKQIQGVNFDDATGAVLDLATAMGTDANAAALQLGKALNDPIKGVAALGKAGVQFSADQKAMIKSLVETGDIAGAQRVILKELEGQMGTAAEAARNTLGGALEGLKNSFNNLLEGDSGSDGLLAATNAVNDLSGAMNDPDVKQGVDNIVGGIASIVAECVQGIGALQRLSENVDTIFDISGKVASGAPLTDFNDRELQVRLANLSTQKSKAKASGNTAEVDRLQKLITAAIREGTRRNIATLFEGVTATVGGGRELAHAGGATTATGSRTSKPGKSDAARQADEAGKALREAAEAQAAWHSRILDMSADLAGPTAQVMRDYDKSMAELTAEFNGGEVALSDYATAQDLLAQRRDKDLQAIKDQVTPLQEVNAAIAEQMRLVGMSADDQEIWNNLKYAGADADEAQRQQIIESTKALQDYREAMGDEIEAMDAIRDGSKNFLKDLLGGTKSWKDSFLDALDSIQDKFLDMIAQNFSDQLFGKQGDPAGGSSGGWFGALMSAFGGGGGSSDAGSLMDLFSGAWGYAGGGKTRPWSVSEVNERGFEMASVGGKDYLLTGAQSVAITPNHKLGGGRGLNQTNNFVIQGAIDRRSQDQIAREVAMKTNSAMRRYA